MLAHILIVFVVSDYVQIIKFHRLYYLPFVLLMNLFSSVCVVSVWHDSLAWYSIALFLLFCHRWDICLAINSVIYSITTHIWMFRYWTSCDYNFWCTCVKWWYLQAWVVRGRGQGGGGQKIAQNKNYICHASYLTNSVVYDHDFWYTSVKWLYFVVFFSVFQNFDFSGHEGGERAKNGPKWQKTLPVVPHISGTMYHMIFTYVTHV